MKYTLHLRIANTCSLGEEEERKEEEEENTENVLQESCMHADVVMLLP